jgi:hypothetical protein
MSQEYVHFCLQPYALFLLAITLHIIYFLHLLSTNHKCTQPCYFPLPLKPAAQKEKMDWNSSPKSSRLRVASVAVPVVLWSLPLFCNNYVIIILYIYGIWLSVSTFGHICGTIDTGSCIQ